MQIIESRSNTLRAMSLGLDNNHLYEYDQYLHNYKY